jgi:hypothetical protein
MIMAHPDERALAPAYAHVTARQSVKSLTLDYVSGEYVSNEYVLEEYAPAQK